ncbi:MAG: hypothetical protein HRT45_19040, partial [Bdellovibrionales bacterium]|nr:hypothetical protein [Bdellovibrionales bacterium]
GHRIAFVHKMQHQRHPWPSWQNYRDLLKNGGITFVGMIFYYLPGSVLVFAGLYSDSLLLILAGGLLIGLATIAIPGFMSHYCKEFDPSEIFNPFIALKRVFQGGRMYWKAWCIALTALALSFIGLLFFGIGFLLTSVWFWQTAGYSFANVFSNRFELTD